jgi:erythromycin esterase
MTPVTMPGDSYHFNCYVDFVFLHKHIQLMRADFLKDNSTIEEISDSINRHALPLRNDKDLNPLMDLIGDAHYVLLGEASHGTHEYYTWRMKITQRLIEEKGFSFIAVEGDWPDCYRVNRYVKNYPHTGSNAEEVLHAFNRWPTWMWANWEMVAFAEWLKGYNHQFPAEKKVGFYGLDVYSLFESLEFIIDYLKKNDKEALETAYKVMECFEPYGNEGQEYARATTLVPHLCKNEVVNLLSEIRNKIQLYNSDYENVFSAEQNALVAVNAEKYYHEMIRGGAESWNTRDRHMVSTLERLMKFYGKNARCIVWEHNTHIGDARATDMAGEGMVNVGQLVSEKHAEDGVALVGFGSYKGSVIAGRQWGDVMRKIPVPSAIQGSWEQLMHSSGGEKNKLLLTSEMSKDENFGYHIPHRAIGVVYNPQYEQYGNYVPSIIPMRYDAFIFIDETTALHPLHIKSDGHQTPETFPFGV